MGALADLVAEMRLDTSDVDKSVSEAESSMSSLSDRAQQTGKSMQSAGATMTKGVTAPLLAMGGLAAKQAASFEKSMQTSVAVMGDVSDSMREDLEQTARDVAKSTTLSHEETAESYYFLASAGLDAAESMEALPAVAALAESGQMDMAEATDYATNIMSAFGYEAQDLDMIIDQMAGTFANHNQTAQDMGEGLAKIGPIAASAGMELEQASAIIGALGDVGYSGSEAATALRSGMASLMNPTGAAVSVLEDLGVQTTDSSGNMRDMADILRDLEAGGASTADMMQIFGQQAGPAMQALLEVGGDQLDEYTASIKDSEGAAEDIADTQRNTLMGSIDILKSNVADLAIQFGDELTPAIRAAADFATTLSKHFSDLSPATRKLVVAVAAVAAAIGPLLFLFGTILTMVPSMIAGFGTLAGAFGTVSAAVVGLPGLILGLSSSFAGALVGAVASVASSLIALPGLIASAAFSLGTTLVGAASAAFTSLIALPGVIASTALSFATTLVGAIGSAITSFLALPGAIASAIIAKGAAILQAGLLATAYGALRTAAFIAAGGVRALTLSLLTMAAPIAALAIAAVALYAAWKNNFLGIRDITQGVVTAVKALFTGDFQTLSELIGGVARRAKQIWTNNIVPIWERAKEVFTWLKVNAIQPFLAWFTPIWQEHLAIVRDEFVKTADVWISKLSAFVEWAKPYISAFLALITKWWGKHGEDVMAIVGPLLNFLKRVFVDGFGIIVDVVVGALRLMRGDTEGFKDSMMSIVDTLVNGVVDLFRWLYKTLVGGSIVPDMLADMISAWLNFHKNILGAIGDFAGDVVQDFKDLASDALKALTDKVSDFRDAGASLIKAVGDGIRNNVSNVKGKVEYAAQKVSDYWPRSPAKEGPLSDIDKIGPGLVDEIVRGIRNNTGLLASASETAASAARGPLDLRDLVQAPTGIADTSRKTLDELVSKHMQFSDRAAMDALRSLTEQEVKGLATSIANDDYWKDMPESAALNAINDVRSGGFISQDLYDELGGGGAHNFLDNVLQTANPSGKVLAEDGSYVDPSFYGGRNQNPGRDGPPLIDFGDVDDDKLISVGELKKAAADYIKREQRQAGRSSTTKPY